MLIGGPVLCDGFQRSVRDGVHLDTGDMPSPTQRTLTPADIAALADLSFGAAVEECAELTGGGYAAVWRVRLDGGRDVVLKVAAPSEVPLLRYEAGLLAAEADYFRLVRARVPAVPVPDVLHEGPDWLFTSHLPGTALPELDLDAATARRELGAAVARLHTVTGPRFGYPGDRGHGHTWSVAFAAIVDDLLADAEAWRVDLPREPHVIAELVARDADVLDLVDRPALVHFDLWDGNVLAAPDDGGVARLSGLVDGERYLYGDPLIDFVSPALFRRIEDEPDHPFLCGYADVTPLDLDPAACRRLRLYRMHLALLMAVEAPSRGMTSADRDLRYRQLDAAITSAAR
jgi:fructosamine-3-kinase